MNTVARKAAIRFNTPSLLLRRALQTDAALAAISAIALLVAGGPLGALFGIPSTALRIVGVIFIPFAALTGWLGTRPRVHRTLVFVVIVLNALWAVDSVLMLLTKWVEPTPVGELFVVGQALIIAVIAEVEFLGLRRSTVVESYARH